MPKVKDEQNRDRHAIIPAAHILIVNEKNETLLSLRQNTGWRDGWYTTVSGHIEAGESAVSAAIREAKEEAGIDVAPEDLHFVHVSHRVADDNHHERVDFFFKVKKWKGEIRNCEPHRCAGLEWHPVDLLPENLVEYIGDVIHASIAGVRYSDEGFIDRKDDEGA